MPPPDDVPLQSYPATRFKRIPPPVSSESRQPAKGENHSCSKPRFSGSSRINLGTPARSLGVVPTRDAEGLTDLFVNTGRLHRTDNQGLCSFMTGAWLRPGIERI